MAIWRLGAKAFLALGILGMAAQARAAVMRNDVPESEYLAFAANPQFNCVGAVGTRPPYNTYLRADGWGAAGSGVLIAPEWVLTAGHVKYDRDGSLMGDDFGFFWGPSFLDASPGILADAFIEYPGYAGAIGGASVDLALMHLSQPITSITPATRFYGTNQIGTVVHGVGYGTPGINGIGLLEFDGQKRAGSNTIDRFGRIGVFSVAEHYAITSFDYYPDMQRLEWQGSPGDSGGGLFIEVGGEMQLMGIHNFVVGRYGLFGETGSIRVSLFNDWIDQTMASYAPVPEPTSLALWAGLGVMGLIAIRQRKRSDY